MNRIQNDNKMPIMIGDEIIDRADQAICPDCGGALQIYHAPNGNRYYSVEAKCPRCGTYLTE